MCTDRLPLDGNTVARALVRPGTCAAVAAIVVRVIVAVASTRYPIACFSASTRGRPPDHVAAMDVDPARQMPVMDSQATTADVQFDAGDAAAEVSSSPCLFAAPMMGTKEEIVKNIPDPLGALAAPGQSDASRDAEAAEPIAEQQTCPAEATGGTGAALPAETTRTPHLDCVADHAMLTGRCEGEVLAGLVLPLAKFATGTSANGIVKWKVRDAQALTSLANIATHAHKSRFGQNRAASMRALIAVMHN